MQRLATESELENDASSTGAVTPPKVVLFGDSISSAVGYGQDSQADNRFGNNVAGVVSSYLGAPVDSQAMGGITTKDALTGSAIPFAGQNLEVPYGTYEKYLKEQRPNVVVLRFGAADAIRLNDPKETLLNIRRMLDLAKYYGATPVLIGVSPFAAGGDSRAGNINVGSIDPYIASAEKINEGIRRLAQQNDLPFVDMQRLAVPQGALLDGVHPTAEFGKSMADYIGKAVKSALPEFGGSNNKYLDFVRSQVRDVNSMLPSNWGSLTGDQRVSWFNKNGVTVNELTSAGVPQSTINAMWGMGYKSPFDINPNLTTEAQKVDEYNRLRSVGLNNTQARSLTESVYGTQTQANWDYLVGQSKYSPTSTTKDFDSWYQTTFNQAVPAPAPAPAPTPAPAPAPAPFSAEGFSQEALDYLNRPEIRNSIRPGDAREFVGDDFQLYKKVGESGSSVSGRTITYDVYDPYGQKTGTIQVNESGLEEGLKIAAQMAVMVASIAVPGVTAAIGGTITNALGISATAAVNAAIGNTVVQTVMNGGDVGKAVQSTVSQWAGAQVGQLTGNAANNIFGNAQAAKVVSDAVNTGVRALINQQDPGQAILGALTNSAVDFATSQIPGFKDLPSTVKSTITNSIGLALQGKDVDVGAMLANATKEGLLSYGLSQIPQFGQADARTQSFITSMLRTAINGGDFSQAAIKFAVGQVQQEFQKVLKAGPALDELKKAGIITDASYYGLTDQQKELVDRLSQQKDPKAAAAQYINEQTTTPDEIRAFYKQLTGKDATSAEADLLATFTGIDEATAKIGLDNQLRVNAEVDQLRLTELNRVFSDPTATTQTLIDTMAEYNITPAFIERVTGSKYDDVANQIGSRSMTQDRVIEEFNKARSAAGLEAREPTSEEILRYIGLNTSAVAQIQADADQEATTFNGSSLGSVKEASDAAKAAGYNNFTGPDGKTYMVSSPVVAIQAGAFDGTMFGSAKTANDAALAAGKETFVGPDNQIYKASPGFTGGQITSRVFDASGYDMSNPQQRMLAAYSAHKLGYKNVAFSDGSVFQLSDRIAESVAQYDQQVAKARGLAQQSTQAKENAFNGASFADKGAAAIAANSAGKSTFVFSDGKVYQVPANFAQLVMPDQTAAETKRLNDQNLSLVKSATDTAKKDFNTAWRALVPFAEPPKEGTTTRNLLASVVTGTGLTLEFVTGLINGVASIKLGAAPTVGYAGQEVEDARKYGVIISPYDSAAQRADKLQQLADLKAAGAQPLEPSKQPPIGPGNAWYDFGKYLQETGTLNSPEAQQSKQKIVDFLKEVPWYEKPIALIAIANEGNWLGITSYIAEEIPNEIPTLLAGAGLGAAMKLGLSGKAALSSISDTVLEAGGAWQNRYEFARSKGKSEDQAKLEGFVAAGVTMVTELVPDFLADRAVLKSLQKSAADTITSAVLNYSKGSGIALGTSFVTEYISGASNAALMNKYDYNDWRWDDALTQGTIEAFVGAGTVGTLLAASDTVKAIGYMKDGTVATVKDLLDRNQNINYSTINRTDPIFDFSGNKLSLDQLTRVTATAVDDAAFNVDSFATTFNDLGKRGQTSSEAFNTALTTALGGSTADPAAGAGTGATSATGTTSGAATGATTGATSGAATGATTGATSGATTGATTGSTAGTGATTGATSSVVTQTSIDKAISDAIAGIKLPTGLTSADVTKAISDYVKANPGLTLSQVTSAITTAISGLPDFATPEDVSSAIDTKLGKPATRTAAATGIYSTLDALTAAIDAAKTQGLNGDAALSAAIDSVADDLGTTKEELLGQIGKTEDQLKTDFATRIGEVREELGGVENRLKIAIAAAEATGLTRDLAIRSALDTVATDLGTTKDDLISQIETTESALRDEIEASQTALGGQITTGLQDLRNSLSDAETRINDKAAEYERNGISRDQALSTAIGDVATELGTTAQNLSDQISQTRTDLSTQITGTQTALQKQIDEAAELLGKPAQAVTQADLNYVNSVISGEVTTTPDLTYDVNRDGKIDQSDYDVLVKVTSGSGEPPSGGAGEPPVFAPGSRWAPTGLFGEISGLRTDLTGQLQQMEQKRLADAAKAKAEQEAQRKRQLGLSMLQPAAGPTKTEADTKLSPLQTSGQSKFVGPLEAFLAQVERNDFTPTKPQQTMMTPQQQPDRYAYGQEPSIDALMDPYGENKPQEQQPQTTAFKAGGLATPLFAAGGGTRYGQYAKGGLNVVHHSGKARVDFRRGDAVTGPGDGQSDDIPAMLADGEFVWPADVVAALGNGSTKAGSDKLYDMMHSIRAHARSSGPKDLPPPAKSPLEYLKKVSRPKSARGKK